MVHGICWYQGLQGHLQCCARWDANRQKASKSAEQAEVERNGGFVSAKIWFHVSKLDVNCMKVSQELHITYSSIKSAVLACVTLAGERANAQVTGDIVRIYLERVEFIRDDKTKDSGQ